MQFRGLVLTAVSRLVIFNPAAFQKMNSVTVREAAGIEYQFSFGAKQGLVKKLP
ncbi:MAG: hypothetical protein AB1861_15445 [Cyanobacteriota bacterium]